MQTHVGQGPVVVSTIEIPLNFHKNFRISLSKPCEDFDWDWDL